MPKYATIVIDSVHEWARLTFSKDMKKKPTDFETIRQMNNYPGATERINMVVRRFKDYQKHGIEVVMTAHEQLEKVYARGGVMAAKGQVPQEPIAVKGWPNIPGSTAPTEIMGACDNVFRMRLVNRKPAWICVPESLGTASGDEWVAKDRFGGPLLNSAGYLPASYTELKTLVEAGKDQAGKPIDVFWSAPYIWLIYGVPGIGKTRMLLTFPRPLHIFDIDRGARVLRNREGKFPDGITVSEYNSEDCDDYLKFTNDLEAANA